MTDTAEATDPRSFACDEPDCTWVPTSANPRAWSLNLGAHKRAKHGIRGTSESAKRDAPPMSVRVDLRAQRKTSKEDPALARVQRRAEGIVKAGAAVVFLAGQQQDAVDIERGAEQLGVAARNLAEHEKWVRDLLGKEGGDAGRVTAYVQMSAAVIAIALPILLRHEVLSGSIAEFLAGAFQMMEAMPPPAPDEEGRPASAVAGDAVPGEPVAA